MEAIPVPRELIVPLTAVLLATVTYLLKDVNKGKGLGTQIWNIAQGMFGVLAAFWLVLNVMLRLTGIAWSRFLTNQYVSAFLAELTIETETFPDWVVILVAVGLFYLSIKVAAGSGTSVWGKIGNILKYYALFLILLGIVSSILFALVNTVAKSFLSNPYVISLLKEFGFVP
ncbi:hypothetical protein CVU76_02475 [Candidatus Dojkabacteria bacterium HGW-Dojkabacteria-1]|uniref:Uncharacterized protein n=1 Tax=Candidatus Dojkabacteria bacterium HGW-Dojkabacteria-1 TaxID=2013761 RepID=A0A2N2F3X6_9BACT|nr:MAG: hypothetical protein CVU76_02475 [Candidatus Dojkabacteria bacterium HGW-Dojkabacteria-1]